MALDGDVAPIWRPSRSAELCVDLGNDCGGRSVRLQPDHHQLSASCDLTHTHDHLPVGRKVRVLQSLILGQRPNGARSSIERIEIAVDPDVAMHLLLVEDDCLFRDADRRAEVTEREPTGGASMNPDSIEGWKAVRISNRVDDLRRTVPAFGGSEPRSKYCESLVGHSQRVGWVRRVR